MAVVLVLGWTEGFCSRGLGGRRTLVQLEQLEGAAGAPALLLGEPVVGIAFVLGRLAHGEERGC